MPADVIIPWRAGCAYRQLALEWVQRRWLTAGHVVRLGELPADEPWCKARAVDEGLKHSTSDVVVIADGDVWCGDVGDHVARIECGELGWVLPHSTVKRLDETSTSHVLHHRCDPGGRLIKQPYKSTVGGGMMVVARDIYEQVPMDPRFVGWGQEDEAWGMALRCLVPGARATADLWHLWHPPAPRKSRARGSDESFHLRNRYTKAMRDPVAMRALLDEAATV